MDNDTIYKKANFYKDEVRPVHISKKDYMFHNGIILEVSSDFLIIEDEKLGVRWIVHPYLFRIRERSKIRIDWEHKEAKWIKPEEIVNYRTVPQLKETLGQVLS